MGQTRHAHILMEPEEYQRLAAIARQKRVSVAELVRTAVRERYLHRPRPAVSAVDRLQALHLDLPDRDALAAELQEAKHARLS